MKHVLTVDVQKDKDLFVFTMHYNKKIKTFKARSLCEGFTTIQVLIEEINKG